MLGRGPYIKSSFVLWCYTCVCLCSWELWNLSDIFLFSRYIASVNRQNLTFKVAVNHLADYSDKELRALRGVFKSSSSPRGQTYVPTLKDVPSSWDWWLQGTLL